MKKLLLVVAACAVGIAFSVLVADRAGSAPNPKADCAALAVPVNSDYNVVYDAEAGELLVQWLDAAGADRSAVVDPTAAACRANRGIARAIERALDAQGEVVAGECASFRGFLASGATTVKGVAVNRQGAVDYVARYCAGK